MKGNDSTAEDFMVGRGNDAMPKATELGRRSHLPNGGAFCVSKMKSCVHNFGYEIDPTSTTSTSVFVEVGLFLPSLSWTVMTT